jgi:hypothetical protein
MARKPKGWTRVVAMGDGHAGHIAGLTPPAWQWKPADDDDYGEDYSPHARLRAKFGALQREAWQWYYSLMQSLKPIDRVIYLGDAIDGDGGRSGGTELITTDRQEQCNMAVKAIRVAGASKYCLVRGTPYHTGMVEDWENDVAVALSHIQGVESVKIGNHEFPEVNGVVFDVKHHIGNTSVPTGKITAIAKDDLWNLIWAEHQEQPRAQIVLRGHVHEYRHSDYFVGGKQHHIATLSALQGMGSKFGAKRCSGHVTFGILCIDISPTGEIRWQPIDANLQTQRASAYTF